ncbi:MAG: 30S ribosomal protein S4 [Candidatus Yanofskybacteria bacterium GW2011_GWA2_41_22]|uniref:Small ribosomal subunit protein uS4 n=5 Tax=Parcubacteria group TaxID=1794811 RepID=A0A1F8HVX0_9BACT|nr:MAG: 30S ribosomal protein S4 [Candidatus Yanofskybacteria bacterium GW2011_GWA2_41_22]KKS25018.1 MAG: 30S ribosomal protein S4 [Candidatus Jorgensenbacteria bacterium GW2011_GWF2_41_8]KKS27121.1 MAG: 30S ribosomal protein S4 [Candidatus Yanofskybacteria bacterium GW2011_GWC2_41_9]OGM99079.1 MAG: 30S ribosomal protein S4 [Candidatus Yanofskybacteria bacterium RIFCSPHIGHO2_01_FULL_41_27]OGN09011.1 MAG: 30S ribosomal protein S4 [Candidatus Yanofskybacteria bacterium RIFCSPHIGHO2_02_FULL_41_12]
MARYLGPREKIERRIGEKLYLKGDRSYSPKSATVKKPYPPGLHGKKGTRKSSEYGQQLRAKQKVKNVYRMLEKQFKSYIKSAVASKNDPYALILKKLEGRLDNIVFRAGIAQSRDQARQIVSHGHITVNGKKINIPSYEIKTGDIVAVKENSKKASLFSALAPQWLKKYDAPAWIALDKEKMSAKINGLPTLIESGIQTKDLQAIIEFYSR